MSPTATAENPAEMPHGHYIIRGGVAGRERLRVLSRVMAPTTTGLLARIGIREGARCLDAGCGGGDVTLELARLAGPGGQVTGIDLDEITLMVARDEARRAGVSSVEYRRAGLDDLGKHSAFDVAYARFLLSHLAGPAQAVRALAQATRPGGVVAVEDVDFAGCFSHPASGSYTAYCDLYTRAGYARGGDPNIGPRLPGMLLAAGLTDVRVHIVQPAGFDPDVKALSPLTLENITETVVALGLISRRQVDTLIGELYAFAAQPSTILSLPRIFQVWGTVGSTAAA